MHFIDDQAALGTLVSGSYDGHALSSIACTFWRLAAEIRTYPYFLYVPSDLNPVDKFTRDADLLRDPFGNPIEFRDPSLPSGWNLGTSTD